MESKADLGWLDAHYRAMPPVAALQLQPAVCDGEALRLRAPLPAHVNDKGCAFGGSLVSLMTLAGWGWLMLQTARAGQPAEVYVADSQIRYLAPLYGDLHGVATLAEGEDWPATLRCLGERGRARVAMRARVLAGDGIPVATLTARFALKRA